jgi:hypothetical protein
MTFLPQAFETLAIGHIPGGSGNGLSTSIMYAAGESTFDAMHAAVVISRGRRKGLDLARVVSIAGPGGQLKIVPSFLAVEWALIADIDIESERYRRCCGSERFTISALQRICCLRRYRGRLSIMPHDASADGSIGAAGPFSRDAFFGTASPTALVPALSEPVPENWLVLEGVFTLLWACNTSHQASDSHLCKTARLDDGLIQVSRSNKHRSLMTHSFAAGIGDPRGWTVRLAKRLHR